MRNPFKYAMEQHARPTPPPGRTKGARNWLGWCLVFVTEAYGVGPRYPDAATAWREAKHRHPETDPARIPRGAPIFWTGGRSGHGHIAIGRGESTCWTSDLVRSGGIDVAPIADVERRWGLTLAGWTEDVNGVRVYTPPKPKPAPKPAPKPQREAIGGKTGDEVVAGLRTMRRNAKAGHRDNILTAVREALAKLTREKGKR